MSRKKIIKSHKRIANLFADGTWIDKAKASSKAAFNPENLGGTIGSLGSAVSTIANSGIQNAQLADTSDLESQISSAESYKVKSYDYDNLMQEWGTFSPVEHVSWKDVRGGSTGQRVGNTINSAFSGASTGATIGGPIGGIVGGVVGLGSSLIGWLTGNAKAKRKARAFNQRIGAANVKNIEALGDRASSIDTQNDLNILANYHAYGGPLEYELAKDALNIQEIEALNDSKITSLPNSFSSPELNIFAKGGGIHIKPENRGKFTKYCGGKVTSECIEKGKRSSDPAVRKRATFAANARKWHHAFGGNLSTNGADWDNGLIMIGNGGTHEENPMEGVQMGVDPNGVPNLVEEGEVIFNDYVFSNRLTVPKAVREKYKLRGSKDITFADAAKQMQKESEERPNDPISKRGLLSSMTKLQQAQEGVRQTSQDGQEGRQYAHGGKMGILYSGTGPYPNFLEDEDDTERGIIGYTKNGVLLDDGSIAAYNSPEYTQAVEDALSEEGIVGKGRTRNAAELLRYAPVIGNTIGTLQNIFSKPDYAQANAIEEAANAASKFTPVDFTPIGNYLQYNPFDRNYYINKLNAQAGATRRAIMNTTSPSRNAALLAADYNAQGRLGDLARQAEEYNLAQRQQVEHFNRATNMTNAEMGIKAAMANQDASLKAGSIRLGGISQAMALRRAIDAEKNASLSANFSNLFESLGNIGIDAANRADRDWLIKKGIFGTVHAKGGKLKKKRGGFTY